MFGKSKNGPEQLAFEELLDKKRNLDLEILGRHDKEIEALKLKVTIVAEALGVSVAELFGIKGEAEPRRRKRTTRWTSPAKVEGFSDRLNRSGERHDQEERQAACI